eukprot:m.78660 g.78660  ORF g.78660 m.78660 type:complete len:554 (-) comp25138_c0_seq3:49-1710(-)
MEVDAADTNLSIEEDEVDDVDLSEDEGRGGFDESTPTAKSNGLGTMPQSKWIPDTNRSHCRQCRQNFTGINRRHHCRVCGDIQCHPCQLYETLEGKIQRVCFTCFSDNATLFEREHPLQPRLLFGKVIGTRKPTKEERVIRSILQDDAEQCGHNIRLLPSCDAKVTPDGRRPLHIAAQQGCGAVVKMLLNKQATPNIKCNNGRTPLLSATRQNNVDVITALIDAGANLRAQDEDGLSLLHHAAESNTNALALLIARVDRNLRATSKCGTLALHHAASQYDDNEDNARLLLEAGMEINGGDGAGNTPLHHAASVGNTAIVRLLTTNGADVRLTNSLGRTPLHTSVDAGYNDTVGALLDAGCDIKAVDVMGRSFFDIANTSEGGLAMMAVLAHLGFDVPTNMVVEPATKVLAYSVPGSVTAINGAQRIAAQRKGFVKTIKLTNDADEIVQFKVEYTGAGHIKFEPSHGSIAPNSSFNIRAILSLAESRLQSEFDQDRVVIDMFKTNVEVPHSELLWARMPMAQCSNIVCRVQVRTISNTPNPNTTVDINTPTISI